MSFIDSLNPEQRRAATWSGPARHLLVLAGAGTGKTRTLVARAIHLLAHGTPPGRLLLLTFTRRAAREMGHRLELELGQAGRGVMAGTFHHFCLQVMRRIPKSFGVENRNIIDRDDQQSLLQLVRSAVVGKRDRDFPKPAQLLNYHPARNTLQPVDEYLRQFTALDEESIARVVQVGQGYEARKRERGYLDYDDILEIFVRACRDKPALRQQLRGLFDHILVDEMQDTNPLQWQLLTLLAEPAQLFCVGDDAQSIYAFRGADFRNVHDFGNRLEQAEVLKLTRNYRSTQPILDIANWLLEDSALDYDKRLSAERGQGLKPVLVDFENRFDEARWLAEDLVERHAQGAPWRDHMVLVRSAWSSRTLEGVLVERNIPYRFIGGTSLLESAHVKDLLSLLRAGLDARDELAWVRYLKCWPRVGDATASRVVAELAAMGPEDTPLEVVARALPRREDILAGLRLASEFARQPATAIEKCAEHLAPVLRERYDRWDARVRDYQLLIKLAARYSDVREFIDTYTLDPVSHSEVERGGEEDVVTLITVHSAKGTEAPVCYLMQVQPGMYPHSRSLGDAEAEEEERRILYVALTRAQNELVITRTGDDNRYLFHGGSTADAATTGYFFEYLDSELVDYRYVGFAADFARGLDGLHEVD